MSNVSDSKIPPRPWRVDRYGGVVHVIGHNEGTGSPRVADCYENGETAEMIVRLVNAEPEIVAALEVANHGDDCELPGTFDPIKPCTCGLHRALALLRGDAPAPSLADEVHRTFAALNPMAALPAPRPPADPDVVAALEAAERALDRIDDFIHTPEADRALPIIRAALAKVRPQESFQPPLPCGACGKPHRSPYRCPHCGAT